jgi:hypothetical protein
MCRSHEARGWDEFPDHSGHPIGEIDGRRVLEMRGIQRPRLARDPLPRYQRGSRACLEKMH